MTQDMLFEGTVPLYGPLLGSGRSLPSTREALILHALQSLAPALEAGLAGGEADHALSRAYRAVEHLCGSLASWGGRLAIGQARVHTLVMDLTWVPLEAMPDGTLSGGTLAVRLGYRSWNVTHSQAAALAQQLLERCRGWWRKVRADA